MDELIIIICIVALCVSVFAGWLASIACCPDQAMACMGNGRKKSQAFLRRDERPSMINLNKEKINDSNEYGYNDLPEVKSNETDGNEKTNFIVNENDQARLIKKEELLKFTHKHPSIGGSLSTIQEGDSQILKPHLVKKHESTDVIEYAIVDYSAFVAQQENSPISLISNHSTDDDDDLLVSCALEDSRDDINEKINYPYKFQEHHLPLLKYDPTIRRESLPIAIDHQRLSSSRDVIKAV
uniref:Uncharacterized protein n=1 Tax=Parastrongyloides trichosuri TaxID=131310 RepID=A0A0N4Z6W7_PARTI